jgi:hypothetical protein
VETLGREVKQQEQKKTNVRKFISVVKKYTDMTQLDATILREFVEQIRVSDTYTTDEQQKRVKIREIEIVYNFIGAFDFEGAREQSQTAQDKNNAKVGAAWRYADPRSKCFLTLPAYCPSLFIFWIPTARSLLWDFLYFYCLCACSGVLRP